jgi:superfamily I DNA/RNA helicase
MRQSRISAERCLPSGTFLSQVAKPGGVVVANQRLPRPKGKQKEVLALPAEGHTVVLGTAGSGKTTMAIHRAALLANPLTTNRGKVLLVTFNRALVAYLNYWRPAALAEVTIENYHRFALGYLASRGKVDNHSICDEPPRQELIGRAIKAVAAKEKDAENLFNRPDHFFFDEIEFLARYGLDGKDYVESDRFGRGAGFARQLRPALLEVRNEYLRLRQAEGLVYDWDDVAGGVLEEFSNDASDRFYRHIVIDEGQDFSPQMLRSLASAVDSDGSLTFFGDMAQQIYGRQVSWKRAGLQVPNGIWEFRRNYRNTPEIATLGLRIAAMPYYGDVPDMVEPDEFEPSGPLPSFVRFTSVADESKFVIDAAKAAAKTGSVGVLMRRHSDERRFNNAFKDGQRLHKNMRTWDPGPGISWGTVHAAKGYEFDTVILVGISADRWPEPKLISARGAEAAAAEDGPLLYVGLTRARRELLMTTVGEPSKLLPKNDGLWQDQPS